MNNLNLLASRVLKSPMLMHGSDFSVVSSYVIGKLTQDFSQFESLANIKKYENRKFSYKEEGFGVIPVIGGLSHRDKIDAECMPITSYESLRSDYDKLRADHDVKAIIFEFDSGGGEARGCFDFSRHIYATRDDKPVLAYINENAYSGAYAIASACHQIILPKTAGVGSIGVIAGRMDQTKMYQDAGVRFDLITSGKFKGDLHPLKPYTKEERQRIQIEVDALASEFYNMVADHRNLTPETVEALEAGTFSGHLAIEAGIADGVMSQDQFYHYLKTTETESMFNFGNNSSETITKEDHDKALSDQKNSLVKQAETAFAETLSAEQGKWQKAESSRQKSIAKVGLEVGQPESALNLIVSGATVEQAKSQLFSEASNVENVFTNHTDSGADTPDSDDGNAMMAAVKAVAENYSA
ncbi:S49 family peptidase [Alteromonadaceae bacterium M269]|nr:S49 family peptidase [Alteromonadaceae bacterium M269]